MKRRITQPIMLESLRYQWREQWMRSIFPHFLNWWAAELLALAPKAWRERLSAHRKVIAVSWPLQSLPSSSDDTKIRLVLAPDEVWPCELELPKQIARNLRSVVSYELDKHTPFTHDQIYFDVVINPSQHKETLQASLIVIDRQRLDRVLSEAKALKLNVVSVDALNQSGRPLGINLLPQVNQAGSGKHLRLIRSALYIAIILLLIVIPATLVGKREQRLEIMRQEVAQLRDNAMEVDAMRKQLHTRNETEKTLNLQSNTPPSTFALLNILTNCVNTDTWLDHLEMRSDGVVTLSGLSRAASELPSQLMRCADLHKAAFQGGVQPDAQSGMDRFTITASRGLEPGR